LTTGPNQKSQEKLYQTSMPSAMPIKKADNYLQVSKSFKNTQSVQNESMQNLEWNWKHPSIQDSFYQKIDPPTDLDDARIKMNCHQHAVSDFDLQVEMVELEMNMLTDRAAPGEVLPYNQDKYDDLEGKKLKLLLGKRFHQNAVNAYWYYLSRCGK